MFTKFGGGRLNGDGDRRGWSHRGQNYHAISR